MIVSIESSLSTFKSVTFHEGLNVLLSDRTANSTDKQTRNSAGKTSLVEIIHFLLGSDCEKDSLFRLDELVEHTFKGTFRIGGEMLTISRSGSYPSKIFLVSGGEDRTYLPRKLEKSSERFYVSNVNWRTFLGHAMFALPADERGTLFDESYTPSFRSMFRTSRDVETRVGSLALNDRPRSSSDEIGRSIFPICLTLIGRYRLSSTRFAHARRRLRNSRRRSRLARLVR